ncbi:hypothetical protein AMTR_s00005p00212150 [Amborella trichopoda]|uniref:Aminotransferase-like plant mobile domain-containing protein n=1 Tax=Amborella trichopoda TaxID=13333 RepID=W1PGQ2_AMBTC|nr:hypothetical protein AMTR_s00005p00212150 [Amborella trichopoda]
MEVAGQYAWRAAVLAFLFQGLPKVIWTPYDDYPNLGEQTEEDRDYGLIVCQIALCRTYLICRHICEGYMSDRVLRQLELHQRILADSLQCERRERRGKRSDNLVDELGAEIDTWTNKLDYICQADEDMFNGKPTQEYLKWDINHAAERVHDGYNLRNWDLVGEALELLKIYDPEVAREDDASEELELDDEMDDNVLPVWLPSRRDKEPSNI